MELDLHAILQVVWFILIGVLFVGYAVLDGFDLGVGSLYPFLGKTEADKAVMRRSVGPVWDGNEVWLLTAGGAMFAAFPHVYASVFSGFYLALMVFLFALIFRAGAMEFRAHDPAWAKFWDGALFVASFLPALLSGVAVGNIIVGLPLGTDGYFVAARNAAGEPAFLGNLIAALNPYAIIIGLVSVAWVLLHGATWLGIKATGDLYDRAKKAARVLGIAFAVLFAGSWAATAFMLPDVYARATGSIWGWLFAVAAVIGIVGVIRGATSKSDHLAFLGSGLAGASLVGIWAASIFPNMVPSTGIGDSLTIFNASSSQLTLTVMAIIAAIGVPLVLVYHFLIYRAYAGRVVLTEGEEY